METVTQLLDKDQIDVNITGAWGRALPRFAIRFQNEECQVAVCYMLHPRAEQLPTSELAGIFDELLDRLISKECPNRLRKATS